MSHNNSCIIRKSNSIIYASFYNRSLDSLRGLSSLSYYVDLSGKFVD